MNIIIKPVSYDIWSKEYSSQFYAIYVTYIMSHKRPRRLNVNCIIINQVFHMEL